MARPSSQTPLEKNKISDSEKSPTNGVSLFKKIARWWRQFRHERTTVHIKKDINRLEQERAKERTALLRQRKFYERLIRQRTVLPKTVKSPPEKIVEPKTEKTEPIRLENPVGIFLNKESEVKRSEPLIIPPSEIKSEEIKPAEIQTEEKKPIVRSMTPPEITPRFSPPLSAEKISESTVPTSSDVLPPPVAPITAPLVKQSFFKKLFKKIHLAPNGSLAEKLAMERAEEEAIKHKTEVEERFWQAYNGVKANLVKDQGVLFFNWHQRLLILALALVLCCLAISLMYVGLLVWQKERLNDNQSTLANFEAINVEIAKNEKEIQEIVDFNNKLELVSFILTNHVHWTNFFAFLENNTLKDVYYESFAGDLTGIYSIPAIARNLDAISLQLEVIKAYNLIRNVQYSGGQAIAGTDDQPEKIRFNLEISVDPKLLLK